ncbi:MULTISPECIES: copper-binding protein [Ramlibacter]|uniref:Copper-binding protein n=1 Tax=Ramlibacter aquaticus TaxID=2780094 RepID=A0ABR9SED3_9BURK|nr:MULTISPECIES: copper-binding protein [Ramlibacter]MBE7940718.1 copper-binding protein [Ramlibacter aquaticus]
MKVIRTLSVTTLALSCIAGGVHAQGMSLSPSAKSASTKAVASTLPLVNAEVRKVDEKKGLIVLKHEDIPNIAMPAMTMGFDIADKKMLNGVKAGDKVKFQAAIVGGKATVTELERAR